MENEFKIERNLDKRYSMQNGLRHEIQYIFSSARKHKTPFETILQNISDRIRNTDKYKKIGEIGRANISGHIEAHFQMMYNELEWVCWYDGVFMGLTKQFEYVKEYNQDLMECGHVYKGTEIRYNLKK